jgi:hypothetical protein
MIRLRVKNAFAAKSWVFDVGVYNAMRKREKKTVMPVQFIALK